MSPLRIPARGAGDLIGRSGIAGRNAVGERASCDVLARLAPVNVRLTEDDRSTATHDNSFGHCVLARER